MPLEITGAQIAQLLKEDSTARADLAEAMAGAFREHTGEMLILNLAVEAQSIGGTQLAGNSLIPIPQWDGTVENLPAFLDEIRQHINRSRVGT